MAGIMSEKELRINCGITLGAEVKSLSRNTNASAMALSGNTVYLAKAHANENGKMVYKSMIFKSSQFVSDTIGDNEKISEINYFVFGMAATADRLYCTCKDETGDSGILEMKFDTSGQKFTKLNTTYVGIDIYKNDEFILMEELNRATPETMKFITGNLNEVQNGRGTKFTVIANEADEYQKANDIHYDSNQGLFILTNHYPDDTQKYSQCKNRILLVKPGNYENNKIYYPYAVFQADQDTTAYKQFNFEGIILYKNNIWVLSNAIETSDKKEHDRISYLPGVTFKKWYENVSEEGNGYFSFNGSTKTGAVLPNKKVNNVSCPTVQGMAIDENDIAYCLKCDGTNTYAVLLKTTTPESVIPDVVAELGKSADSSVYHCNGMTYNPNDKNLYVCGYTMGNNVKSDIVVLSKTGKVKNRYHLSEPQYGIAYFGKSVKGYEFILMNKWHEDEGGIESEKIFFDKIEIKDDTVLVKPTKFYVEIGRTSDDVLQDIYYHEKYGMFFPVCSKSNKARVVLYHISNESVKTVMESDMSSTLKPDFAIIINKSKNFVSYETESMDIEKKSGKMIICGNFRVADGSEKGTEKDSFQIFNTLTFV